MGTPARTSITLDIQSTLEGISVANGYNTDITTVEPILRPRDATGVHERTLLGFGLDLERYQHQAYNNMRIQVPWLVVGYFAPDEVWATMSSKVNLLIDDIIVAVMTDNTLGGHAVQTVCTQSETGESDPEWRKGGWCFVDFVTTYFRDTTAS